MVNLDTPEILGIVFACVAGALLALWSWRRGGGHKDGPLAQGELVIATWLPLIEWTPTVTLLIVAPSVVVGTIGWASPPA